MVSAVEQRGHIGEDLFGEQPPLHGVELRRPVGYLDEDVAVAIQPGFNGSHLGQDGAQRGVDQEDGVVAAEFPVALAPNDFVPHRGQTPSALAVNHPHALGGAVSSAVGGLVHDAVAVVELVALVAHGGGVAVGLRDGPFTFFVDKEEVVGGVGHGGHPFGEEPCAGVIEGQHLLAGETVEEGAPSRGGDHGQRVAVRPHPMERLGGEPFPGFFIVEKTIGAETVPSESNVFREPVDGIGVFVTQVAAVVRDVLPVVADDEKGDDKDDCDDSQRDDENEQPSAPRVASEEFEGVLFHVRNVFFYIFRDAKIHPNSAVFLRR